MRFDDSLSTVLSADTRTAFGVAAAWRQLVDLIGRGRAGNPDPGLARLRALRDEVPLTVRAASARALATATPPAALVALFAQDDPAVAAPVLRTATLTAAEWLRLLPALTPRARAVLRHRRDLPAEVVRGLESFGATDFVLGHDGPAMLGEETPAPSAAEELLLETPLDTSPFVAVSEAARAIPAVAEALESVEAASPSSEIADLVARIDAFQRNRAAAPPAPPAPPEWFTFSTDAAGVIRSIEGVARGPLVGVTLAHAGPQGVARLDAAAADALRERSRFRDIALEVGGGSSAAGRWRLAGEPTFDGATGRFTGMAGIARRAPAVAGGASASEQLRGLVHELRTPATAIAGFAELIGSELLGPVPAVYRERATLIGREAGELIGAIEDLDTAARLEGGALELRPRVVDLAELVRGAARELQSLAAQRGAVLTLDLRPALAGVDDRAAARLVARLLATVVGAAGPGERLRAQVAAKTRSAKLTVTRPRALAAADADEALLAIETDGEGGTLLGAGFALRLARALAAELGGRLELEADRLTLRLPLAHRNEVEQAAAQ